MLQSRDPLPLPISDIKKVTLLTKSYLLLIGRTRTATLTVAAIVPTNSSGIVAKLFHLISMFIFEQRRSCTPSSSPNGKHPIDGLNDTQRRKSFTLQHTSAENNSFPIFINPRMKNTQVDLINISQCSIIIIYIQLICLIS